MASIALNSIDGHFWVERDGKIIDNHFKEYDYIASVRCCFAQEKDYLEAPEATQKLVTLYAERMFQEKVKIMGKFALQTGFGRCYQNATQEIAKNGGRLVFGSLGFKLKKEEGYFYEYGGKDWMKMKEFIKIN